MRDLAPTTDPFPSYFCCIHTKKIENQALIEKKEVKHPWQKGKKRGKEEQFLAHPNVCQHALFGLFSLLEPFFPLEPYKFLPMRVIYAEMELVGQHRVVCKPSRGTTVCVRAAIHRGTGSFHTGRDSSHSF
jgi:hypothetical protein